MAGSVRRRGTSWQAVLAFREPDNPTKVGQYTATRCTNKGADRPLAELVLKKGLGRLVRGSETFAAAAAR